MRILYVTRKYPPTVGGMETVAQELYEALRGRVDVELVAIRSKHGGRSVLLPFLYVCLLGRALFAGLRRRPDCIYVQDGVLGPLGWLLRLLLRVPVVVTIHGTEVAYSNRLYRKLVFPFLRRLTAAAVISHGTRELAATALPGLPLQVIHWGVRDEFFVPQVRAELRANIAQELGLPIEHGPLVYLAGRLIERKGAVWFVRYVMPELHARLPELHCIIAGEGEDAARLKETIGELGLDGFVHPIGNARGARRGRLYTAADVFILPNIPAYGFEGFGMVAIEASSCGTPVIASRLEGICDAVVDGQTGYLLPPGDAGVFIGTTVEALDSASLDRGAVREITLRQFNWEQTSAAYLELFAFVTSSSK